jgi:purine-nucleoside phosphorylase
MGLSMITNMAAGITGEPLTHEEVIETSRKSSDSFKRLIKGIITRLGKLRKHSEL